MRPALQRALALGILPLALTAAGCGLGGGSDSGSPAAGSGPDEVLAQLTSSLAQHTLDGVPLGGAAVDLGATLGSLADYPVVVEAGEPESDGDGPTSAPLHWQWDLGGHPWTYDTTVRLTRDAANETGWAVDWAPQSLEPSLAEGETVRVVRTLPKRGDILGAGGVRLVTERPVVRFGLDKSAVPATAVRRAAARIARALDIDVADFQRTAAAAGARAYVEGLVLRRSERGAVGPGFEELPGALAIDDTLALAPTREFAAPILGRVGPATAEIVADSKGRVHAGDTVGLSGLEARYDEQLGGSAGLSVEAAPAAPEGACPDWPACGDADDAAAEVQPRVLTSVPATPGRDLTLTLDRSMQERAERALADATGSAAHSPTALVAIRPSTGAILAAANGPANDGLNAATYGQYPPGSTFKVVSSLALLRAGVSPRDMVQCQPAVVVNGKRFENYDDYPSSRLGRVTLRTAIANSCNTAVISERGRLEDADLSRAAASLGLGVDHDLGFPAYFGQAPAAAGETERAADLIGQGKILASPMAMATVAASVAAGHTVVPTLIAGQTSTVPSSVEPLSKAEAAQLRELMRAVVTEGSGRFLAGLPGQVGAKTGTAEYGSPQPDGSLRTHAWMIATQGDLAVAVFVGDGASGSGTAGPILEDFLS